jgi:hypothetical protein
VLKRTANCFGCVYDVPKTARKSDICRDAGLGPVVSLLSPFPSARPWKIAFQAKQIEESLNHLRESHRVSQFSGLLLGLSLSSYRVRELAVCLVFFTLLFASLALGAALAYYAGKYVIRWVNAAPGVTPVVASKTGTLTATKLQQGQILLDNKVAIPATGSFE